MGDHDFSTHGWRRRRAEARENLRALTGGPRWFHKGRDVTKFEIAKETRVVAQMDILIADYEADNANEPHCASTAAGGSVLYQGSLITTDRPSRVFRST